jgi:hypothetical protein
VPEQQAEQSGAKEAAGKTAKQSTAEEARTRRRLSNRARLSGLRERALHWRGCIRRSLRSRRCGERARPAAAAGEAAPGARMRVGSNKHNRGCNRGQGHQKALAHHFGLPRQTTQENMYG